MIESYKKLKNIKINNAIPKTILPSIADGDYQGGNIERYFLQEAGNDSATIFEVSKETFDDYGRNHYYKRVSLIWRISGPLEDSWDEMIYTPSVITSNRKSIENAAKIMPSIKLYLVNLKQFWKPL